MAAGDPIVAVGTIKTLEASGAAVTNGSVVQADDANYSLADDAASWPDAEFLLSAAWTTAPTEGRVVNLYARPLDIDGSADAEAPESSRPTLFVGCFVANNVGGSATQHMPLQGLIARDLPRLASYFLHNDSGQSVNSGWVLKVIPRNVIPSP